MFPITPLKKIKLNAHVNLDNDSKKRIRKQRLTLMLVKLEKSKKKN